MKHLLKMLDLSQQEIFEILDLADKLMEGGHEDGKPRSED